MRGTIRQTGPDSYKLIIYRGMEDGKRKYDYHRVRGSRRDAEKELARLVNAKHRGDYVRPSKQTVAGLLREWLVLQEAEKALRTYEGYTSICEQRLIPALGSIQLDKLTPSHIESYKAKALKSGRRDGKGGLSPQTVVHHLRALHTALEYAVRMDKLARNPCDRVQAPQVDHQDMQTLGASDMLRMLAELQTRKPKLYIPTLLAATTGLRLGEVLGLRWTDVDQEAGTVTVQQTLQRTKTKGLAFKPPKTRKSRRTVPLPRMTVEALQNYWLQLCKERMRCGLGKPPRLSLVCCEVDGSPLDPNYVSKQFGEVLKRIPDMPRVRFHDLRHGMATLMLKAGTQLKVVSDVLGHSKTGITGDLYSHVDADMKREATRRIDEMLQRAASDKPSQG